MKSLLKRTAHRACYHVARRGWARFDESLGNVRETQEAIFRQQLQDSAQTAAGKALRLDPRMSVADFQAAVPLSDYNDWRDRVEAQRSGHAAELTAEACERYQPTSGSTSKVKWIPYTRSFLNQLDEAINPWIADLFQQVPGVGRGSHYWSLSWVPTELRESVDGNVNDDMELLPLSKRIFMSLTGAVPPWVAYAPSSSDSVFAGLCYLVDREDLSLMWVWSPTFILNLMEALTEHRQEIAQALAKGDWGPRRKAMGKHPCPKNRRAAAKLAAWNGNADPAFFASLWPKLALISAWDTSTSSRWAREVQSLFPHAEFQGKGLWATEGVVTIPFRGEYPLAVRSHFYEFKDLNNGEVLPAWMLEPGQEVQPVMTTGSGFLRYAMRDRLRVTGRMKNCPTFEFLGRMDGIDLVGEKLSPQVADAALDAVVREGTGDQPLSLLAVMVPGVKPFYLTLVEGEANPERDRARAQRLETELGEHFHYHLARDLNQLGPVRCLTTPNARDIYRFRGRQKGMVEGDMKIEALTLWDVDLHPEMTPFVDMQNVESKARQTA